MRSNNSPWFAILEHDKWSSEFLKAGRHLIGYMRNVTLILQLYESRCIHLPFLFRLILLPSHWNVTSALITSVHGNNAR